jgi:hypothetical protein
VAAFETSLALDVAAAIGCPNFKVLCGADRESLALRMILTLEDERLIDTASFGQHVDDLHSSSTEWAEYD